MMYAIFLDQQQGGSLQLLITMGLVVVVFYFFMIRPQQKKAKDQKSFREGIKKGDDVVTIGGLHGKIASIESDDTVMIEVDTKGTRMKFEKAAISMESSKKSQTTTK